MKDTSKAFFGVGVLAAAWLGGAEAQQTFPPYHPTTQELRGQGKAPAVDRLGQLEERVSALEEYLARSFNEASAANGELAPRVEEQPVETGPASREKETGPGKYHLILEGETLHGIARRHGVALEDLVAENQLDPYGPIYVGDRLRIPGGAPGQAPAPEPVPELAPYTEVSGLGGGSGAKGWTAAYKVRPGDTLHSIARRAGVTPQEIALHNRLANANEIFVGQALVLPSGQAPADAVYREEPRGVAEGTAAVAESYHYYDVVAGDTLTSIARIFFTTEAELRRLNELGGAALEVGQRIMVPTRLYFENLKQQQQNPLS